MSHAIFSSDGSALLFADVFGLTRFALGKAVKVKHTAKVSSAVGDLSMNAPATLALVRGRVQTGAYGSAAVVTVGLPALGLRDKLAANHDPHAITTTAAGDRVVTLTSNDALIVYALQGGALYEERKLDLAASSARPLDARVVGPQAEGHSLTALHVAPDGHFVARGHKGVYAGRVGADAAQDEVWWSLPLSVHCSAEVTLSLAGATAWIFVRDAAAELVYALSVERDGTLREITRPSLSAPAVDGAVMLTQPDSGTVVAWSLADGSEQRHEVAAWNAHPAEEPEAKAYPRGVPPMPTRLPGVLAVRGAQRWFVPWHREFAVDLARNTSHPRGLDAAAGPFRRLLLERFAQLNESLHGLRVEVCLSAFERHPKEPRVSLSSWKPPPAKGISGRIAEALVQDLYNRVELATHGHRWSSFGAEGGYAQESGPASLDEARALLAWMIAHDVIPTDVAGMLGSAYDNGLGIPSSPRPGAFPFEAEGERLVLRAALETLAANGWTVTSLPDAWRTEPITLDLALAVLSKRGSFTRYLNRETPHMLSKMIARHLGAEGMALLLAFFESAVLSPLTYDDLRWFGEAIAWLAHHHPELRDEVLSRIDACLAPGNFAAHNSRHDLELTRERVARGAKHFWSNA
jgi:hypothetical protein